MDTVSGLTSSFQLLHCAPFCTRNILPIALPDVNVVIVVCLPFSRVAISKSPLIAIHTNFHFRICYPIMLQGINLCKLAQLRIVYKYEQFLAASPNHNPIKHDDISTLLGRWVC